MTSPIDIRPLTTEFELDLCVELQRRTWGPDFREIVFPAMLTIVQKIGGIAAGAFDGDDMLGFVFGLSGVRDGRPVHWSHMLAVRPEAQGTGLGRRLKLYQRQRLLEAGITTAYWTYDPLVSRNAHFNLNRLGVRAIEYVRDMYGGGTGSTLHNAIGTDRLVVEWELDDERVAQAIDGQSLFDVAPFADTPALNREPQAGTGSAPTANEIDTRLNHGGGVRIAIPEDIGEVQQNAPQEARDWRWSTRAMFEAAFDRDYRVVGFHRGDDGCFYCLRPAADGGGTA